VLLFTYKLVFSIINLKLIFYYLFLFLIFTELVVATDTSYIYQPLKAISYLTATLTEYQNELSRHETDFNSLASFNSCLLCKISCKNLHALLEISTKITGGGYILCSTGILENLTDYKRRIVVSYVENFLQTTVEVTCLFLLMR